MSDDIDPFAQSPVYKEDQVVTKADLLNLIANFDQAMTESHWYLFRTNRTLRVARILAAELLTWLYMGKPRATLRGRV